EFRDRDGGWRDPMVGEIRIRSYARLLVTRGGRAMIDQRIIKVGIEVNGKLHEYESSRGFRISGSGSKSANATQNSFEATITGLNRETRDYLITETSPFNESEKPKRLWL